mmetsp:Transcript_15187/g.40986  ORF Transcript_15187/g.40986 Transcript_15187/m.40986 type:complete len:937 (+) Transcript_15187:233-3043(+)
MQRNFQDIWKSILGYSVLRPAPNTLHQREEGSNEQQGSRVGGQLLLLATEYGLTGGGTDDGEGTSGTGCKGSFAGFSWATVCRDLLALLLGCCFALALHHLLSVLPPATAPLGLDADQPGPAAPCTPRWRPSTRAPGGGLFDPPGRWRGSATSDGSVALSATSRKVPMGSAGGMVGSATASSGSDNVGIGGPTPYAFVQVAYDDPIGPPRRLWRALAMARALQRLSRYPLVLLTDAASLPGSNEPIGEALLRLNVHVMPATSLMRAGEVEINLTEPGNFQYLKILIWGLTQFKKIIWLDTDGILFGSVDWLFEYDPAWEMHDDRECAILQNRGAFHFIRPSHRVYDALVSRYKMGRAWHERIGGLPELIGSYLEEDPEAQRPRTLTVAIAASGTCLFNSRGSYSMNDGTSSGSPRRRRHHRRRHNSIRRRKRGRGTQMHRFHAASPELPLHFLSVAQRLSATMPAYIHRSSTRNECFYTDLDAQRDIVNGVEVNVCTYHLLGAYWRDLFCEAAKATNAWHVSAEVFCDDDQWFGFGPSSFGGGAASRPRLLPWEGGVAKHMSICNAWAAPPDVSAAAPRWDIPFGTKRSCFEELLSRNYIGTQGGMAHRNWCWVGFKEYGCHWHLWKHYTWREMHQIAVESKGTVAEPVFSPLEFPEICDRRDRGASPNWTDTDWGVARQWFDHNVAVYVLTLKASVERRATIRHRLSELSIRFQVVYGVDLRKRAALAVAKKKGLIPRGFSASRAQKNAFLEKNAMGPIAGTIGCAAGHFRVQLWAARDKKQNRPITLIFEDDVTPADDFVPRLWSLVTQELPCDWQAVALRSGCPYGQCFSPRLSRVRPDANEPAWRCMHGVNYGFQGMLYRTSDIPRMQKVWKRRVFNEDHPHCLDVDVALASLSNQIAFYAVPASQDPGFLKETGQGSTRWSINQASEIHVI